MLYFSRPTGFARDLMSVCSNFSKPLAGFWMPIVIALIGAQTASADEIPFAVQGGDLFATIQPAEGYVDDAYAFDPGR